MQEKWKIPAVLGVVGLLMFAGATMLVSAEEQTQDLTDLVDAGSNSTQYNLTLQAISMIDGELAPVSGVTIEIWSIELNETVDKITVTMTRVDSATTDDGGNVSFQLPAGEYLIKTNNSEIQMTGRIILDQDTSAVINMDGHLHGPEMRERHGCRDMIGNATQIQS